jgi:GNAT superfamily N-acetyltransferase
VNIAVAERPKAVKKAAQVVREATPNDFRQIMILCAQLYAENGSVPVDWETVELCIMDAINGHGAVIGVIGEPHRLEGIIYLQLATFWYSKQVMLQENFSFVAPDFRRSQNAKLLVNYAKRAADKFKVPLIIGILSNKRTRSKIKLYERILGPMSGGYFLYGSKLNGR